MTVEHAHLIGSREDVGEHEDLLIDGVLRHGVGRGVGKRHPYVLCLRAVDQVSEDPPSATDALAVTAFSTEPAGSTGRDARDEYSVSGRELSLIHI